MARKFTLAGTTLVLLILTMPVRLLAWGKEGHHIVAQIAMKYMTASTKQKVMQVLGNTSPEEASTWMDEMSRNKGYRYMKTWHYLDVPKGQHYKDGGVDHIIAALNHSYNDLAQNRVKGNGRKEALMILFHLVGDLHQPMHVGYPEDDGGNQTDVSYAGRLTDLHQIWDSELIETNKITTNGILTNPKITKTPGVLNHYRQGNFVRWMKEPRDMLDGAYDISKGTIDKEYINRNKLAVELLLYAAGVRLAMVLEAAFGNVDSKSVAFGKGTEFVSSGYISKVEEPEEAVTPVMKGSIYTPEQAVEHIGERATICGKVFSVAQPGGNGITYINIGAAHPKNPFTAIIFQDARTRFSAAPEKIYSNRAVCVSGTIEEFRYKPQIVVRQQNQIELQ